MRVDVYSRHDAYLATLGPGELLGFVHTDELNGEDSVDVTTTFALAEGMRLVWRDNRGKAHEHVCQDPKGERKGGATVYSDTALNSICELFGDYIVDKRPYGYSFANALQVALEPTRWAMGTVDQPGTVSSGLTFYHTSAREALNAILECGGELETVIEVSNGGVSARKACIRRHRGDAAGHRRFANGKDLIKAERTEHWGAITACYGYGKGVETGSGGYGRKLTFGDVNGGKDYVEDAAALKAYGRPDGKGGMAHVFGTYENSDCEDAAQLLAETRAYLDEHKVPGVTYKVDVADLVAMGRTWEGVGVGDDAQIVDTCFSPALRCEGRVTKLVTDCLGGTCKVTLGNVAETFADLFSQQQQAVSSLSRRSSSWDVAASTPAAYLQQLLSGLNERFNMAGMSYMHASFEHGIITASVPLDENGSPTKTPATAMQMCSQGFRIASGTKADGTFDWQTFGTGEGFFANLIVAGILDAGLIKAGILQDAAGKNYINMETGDCRLAATTTVGGKGIATSDTVTELDEAMQELAKDGVVTAAERAAVAKVQQALEKESARLKDEFAVLIGTPAMTDRSWSSGQAPYGVRFRANYDAVFAEGKAYDQLLLAIGDVAKATKATTLSAAMDAYKSAYENYADKIKTYLADVQTANDLNAQAKVNALDTSLDQTAVFNRLTNNGATQGIYMQNGKLYLNASYMGAGLISNRYNKTNYWNLDTGTFKAGSITATGSFLGGSKSSGYGMELTTGGRLAGYYGGTQYGYIDCSATSTYIPTGETWRGIQIQAKQNVRISSPHIAVKNSSDTSQTATVAGTGSLVFMTFPNGMPGEGWNLNSVKLQATRISFINGLCTNAF